MRHKNIAIFASAAALILAFGCASPELLTPNQVMTLRQAQTRSFEIPLNTVFSATLSYLQDNMYQIRQANKESGLINAYKSKDVSEGEKFWGAFFVGASAKKGDTYDVTFTFEVIDESNTKVRCNITHGVSNLVGVQTNAQPVTDAQLYKGMLDALFIEVQRKHMTNSMRQKKAPDAGQTTAEPQSR